MSNHSNKPILITGCARSGTSLIAGIINLCGAFGGKLVGPTRLNQKGMFENKKIRDQLVKPFLKSMGADPLGQLPLPDRNVVKERASDAGVIENWKHTINQIMIDQGYKDGLWFYKGAKMCLVWAIWHAAFPNARWIIVRRLDADIIASCKHTTFMLKCGDGKGWQGWIDEHKRCFEEMHDSNLDITEVWSENIVSGDFEKLHSVIEKAGFCWNENAVKEFVEPKLFRQKGGAYPWPIERQSKRSLR